MIKLKLTFCIGALALIVMLVLLSPVFGITEITVTGNDKVRAADILAACGVQKQDNLFAFNTRKATANALGSLNYIDSITFRKNWPNELTVTVVERKLSGYVKYMNDNYLYIDENGRVLEVSGMFTENLPIVVGLKFSGFSLGEPLAVDNITSFSTLVTLTRLFDKYEAQSMDLRQVDVSDSSDIHLYIHNIDVAFGSVYDADEKLRAMKEIIANMPDAENIRGVLDMRTLKNKYTFKVLT